MKISHVFLRTVGSNQEISVLKGLTLQRPSPICQNEDDSYLLGRSSSFLIMDFLAVFPTSSVKLLIWEINRAIELYLETRYYALKSLPLEKGASCESGDETDHRYQKKYQHLPESQAFSLGIYSYWGDLGEDHWGKMGGPLVQT